jgi:hypothetical protein
MSSKVYDPRADFPVYCHYDGKRLLDGEDGVSFFYDEKTGQKKRYVRYSRYCPDWQIDRSKHTEYYGQTHNENV